MIFHTQVALAGRSICLLTQKKHIAEKIHVSFSQHRRDFSYVGIGFMM